MHTWPLARLDETSALHRMQNTRVEQYMSTDLFTVNEEELVELVACLMDWQRIRHVLVENNQHQLVGLVTHRSLLRYLAEFGPSKDGEDGVAVKEIMTKNPIAISPETSTIEAIRIMRSERIGALPVVREGQLVGVVTEREFMQIAGRLLEEGLGDEADEEAEEMTERP